METFLVGNKLHTKRTSLYNWEFNLNTIRDENFQKLVQARYDYIPVEPLLVMPDGLILGGNHRNLADTELNVDNEWIEVIDFIEEDGRWFVVADGEVRRDKRSFGSKEEAMTSYSLLHNARYAGIDPTKLANLTGSAGFETFDWDEFPVLVGAPLSPKAFQEKVAPGSESHVGEVEASEPEKQVKPESAPKIPEMLTVKCPDCACKFSVELPTK